MPRAQYFPRGVLRAGRFARGALFMAGFEALHFGRGALSRGAARFASTRRTCAQALPRIAGKIHIKPHLLGATPKDGA